MKTYFNKLKARLRRFIANCCREAFEGAIASLREELSAIRETDGTLREELSAVRETDGTLREELSAVRQKAEDIDRAIDEFTAYYRARESDVQNCMDYIQQRADHIVQRQLDLADVFDSFTAYYKAREGDVQNCIDYIQRKLDLAIERQSDQVPFFGTLLSFVQNAAIPREVVRKTERYRYYKTLHELTEIGEPAGPYRRVRIGRAHDGGYVMLEPLSGTEIAYSIGISDDVSWDLEMAARGYQLFQYDHTIQALPEEDPHFHWKKLGLGGEDHGDIRTLETLMTENGHMDMAGMVLKIDIEGSEWETINSCSKELLEKFDQIVLEMHDLAVPQDKQAVISALRRLHETHFAVHVHGNNYNFADHCGELITPNLLEITYLNRAKYACAGRSTQAFPLEIDAPNKADAPDLQLGIW